MTPKIPKMSDPVLVTLLKLQRRYSQPSRENVTPSRGTSPLAYYQGFLPREEHPISYELPVTHRVRVRFGKV